MKKRITFFLISLLMPGIGYLRLKESGKFYVTIVLFYSTVIVGSVLRLYPTFSGFVIILLSLLAIHVGTAAHAAMRRHKSRPPAANGLLKWAFTSIFFALTVTSFGHSRTVMGFDRVSMAVQVMEPEIMPGEQLLVDSWAYKSDDPERGDIVIHSFSGQVGIFLNRIIAVGGDTIEIKEGDLFINGVLKKEDYVSRKNVTKAESTCMPSMVVPINDYFVMGDNRDKSFGDSRFNGTIHANQIKGKVTCILYSSEIYRLGKRFSGDIFPEL